MAHLVAAVVVTVVVIVGRFVSEHGMALLGVGISISLDKLAVGVSLGLTDLSLPMSSS